MWGGPAHDNGPSSSGEARHASVTRDGHAEVLLQRLFDTGTLASLSDPELAARFAATRDPEAFAVLVGRHGPTVMAVCRGLLGPAADADAHDAFQATFLVLLNRLGTFRVGPSLCGWLRLTARRVIRQIRRADGRRRRREYAAARAEGAEAQCQVENSELISLIRDEVNRLPERDRVPLVLCEFDGLTRDEAAAMLECPPGTVAARVARARLKLRDRLQRRGAAPAVVFPAVAQLVGTASSRHASLDASIRAASSLAAGTTAAPKIAALAARCAGAAWAVPLKAAVAVFAVACILGGVFALATPDQPPAVRTSPAAKPDEPANGATTPDPDDPAQAGRFTGRVAGPDGRPFAGARIFIVRDPTRAVAVGKVRTTSDASGRFTFEAPDMTRPGLDGLPVRLPGMLVATADGVAPDWIDTWGETGNSFVSHYDPVKGADLSLKLARSDVPIHGRILDSRGRPLAAARVRVTGVCVPRDRDLDAHLAAYRRANGDVLGRDSLRFSLRPSLLPGLTTNTVTDADGRFRITGLGRDWLAYLTVSAPTVVSANLTVMTRDDADLILTRDWNGNPLQAFLGAGFAYRMNDAVTVTVVVRDAETHQPIAGMVVRTQPDASADRSESDQSGVTGADGRFVVPGVNPHATELTLFAVPEPGRPYVMTKAAIAGRTELVIECPRGIPFQLRLADEAGRPVEAEVEYQPVSPNPELERLALAGHISGNTILCRAARRSDGTYEGFVVPGPGAVLVKTPSRPEYRPAHVKPKEFFAPGKTMWTDQELYTSYGDDNQLHVAFATAQQHDYAAIVLVNPPAGSPPLALTATVARDRPRTVTLVDTDGRPVVGARAFGLRPDRWDAARRLRAATVPVMKLHPTRSRRIVFVHDARHLVGFLIARGDAETPYTVQLRPWATVTGRIVDQDGQPLAAAGPPGKAQAPASLSSGIRAVSAGREDPAFGLFPYTETDAAGRFRVERLVPGQRYSARAFRARGADRVAFENLVLEPGEVRDLGDIRVGTASR
jgi:RNA polymerase sigma factor (sigma-70 family)